jgi:hypothetical protein
MIMFTAKCDHPDCGERGPEAETGTLARGAALDAGWQRWRAPDGELLDLCPPHRQPIKAKIVYETPGQT